MRVLVDVLFLWPLLTCFGILPQTPRIQRGAQTRSICMRPNDLRMSRRPCEESADKGLLKNNFPICLPPPILGSAVGVQCVQIVALCDRGRAYGLP